MGAGGVNRRADNVAQDKIGRTHMSKTSGYSNYACDRCSKSVFAQEMAPEVQSWRTIERITADGVKTTRLLCPDCAASYREVAQAQDTEFGDFMARKGE